MLRRPTTIAFTVGLLACSTTPADPSRLPDSGNALLVATDITDPSEGYARVYASQRATDMERVETLTLNVVVSDLGFGRGFTIEEWNQFISGATLTHDELTSPMGTHYIDEGGREISRAAVSERLRRVGETLEWTIEFGAARDMGTGVVPDADPRSTMTVTFTPEFVCNLCMPGSEACIGQEDPMLSSSFCRAAVADFGLVESGFVDPALLE